VADPEIVGGGCGRATSRAGVGCGEGYPLPTGEGFGEGAVPRNDLKMASFGALWVPVVDASLIPP